MSLYAHFEMEGIAWLGGGERIMIFPRLRYKYQQNILWWVDWIAVKDLLSSILDAWLEVHCEASDMRTSVKYAQIHE